MSETSNDFIKYRCPKCGTVIAEFDPQTRGFMRIKCRNRHCGKIVPIWLDGSLNKK